MGGGQEQEGEWRESEMERLKEGKARESWMSGGQRERVRNGKRANGGSQM